MMAVFADLSLVTWTVMGDGYRGDLRPSSQASNQGAPQFDWGAAPTGAEEGPQDLRGKPLPMSLKRAMRYECLICSENRVLPADGQERNRFHVEAT